MIRSAHYGDIPQVAGLISDFYQESKYDAPPINPEKTAHVLKAYIDDAGEKSFFEVIDTDDRKNTLVGFMIGERTHDLWSDALKTVEVALYVRPLFRGRPSAGRLLLNFAKWAEAVPSMIRVEASSGITEENAARVYAKLGWSRRGTLHGVELH